MSTSRENDTVGKFGLRGALETAGAQAREGQNQKEMCGSNDHLISIYETKTEQFEAVVPFIRQGLTRGERCLYVADENTEEEVIEVFQEGGIEVADALDSGRLSIYSKGDLYLQTGAFDTETVFELLREILDEVLDGSGYTGVRSAGEMTWALEEGVYLDRIAQYESLVNDLNANVDHICLCQYNRNRFPDAFLSKVIRAHPVLVTDGTICGNVHYYPPGEYFPADRPALDVDRTVRSLVQHARARQLLRSRDRQEQTLASSITQVEGEEWLEVASTLYDDFQQRLHGTQLKISRLRETLERRGDETLAQQIEEIECRLKGVNEDIRQLSNEISPPALELDGLTAALEWLQSRLKASHDLSVDLTADGEYAVEEGVRFLLFRVTRELLSNVVEHAGVSEANVRVWEENNNIFIRVTDEGKGFTPDSVEDFAPEQGLGLGVAQAKIRHLGGDLRVRSVPGEGTSVTVSVPISEDGES